MKVKTTLTWVGSGTAPSKVKVCLDGRAFAGNAFTQSLGSYSASNGLGNPQLTTTGPMGIPSLWFGNSKSEGKKYREFSSNGGTVSFKTELSAESSGIAQLGASTSFSAAESQWAVSIASDRGETFRRVADAAGVRKVSNYFEDDGLTSRGGDGKVYGDSVATLPNLWNGFDLDFASTFTPSASGPWSFLSTASISSSRELSRSNVYPSAAPWYQTLVCGFEDKELKSVAPLDTFTVDANASDSENNISDACKYEMKVHLPAEKAGSLGISTSHFLHRVNETFPEYQVNRHAPESLFSRTNLTADPMPVSYTVTDTREFTVGWEYSFDVGAELPLELAKVLFGAKYTVSGTVSVTTSTSIGTTATVPVDNTLVVWGTQVGSVEKVLTSRFNDQGYRSDAKEFVVKTAIKDVTFKTYGLGVEITWP